MLVVLAASFDILDRRRWPLPKGRSAILSEMESFVWKPTAPGWLSRAAASRKESGTLPAIQLIEKRVGWRRAVECPALTDT